MDANAYLKRHGWRGDGHSLDTTNRGIRKPLLVSKKIDVLGVGLNKHAAVSDQWWMRAFDEGLKNLGTDKKSTLSTVREHGIHLGGLYGRFVKGETVEGTIGSGSTSEDDKVKAMGGEVLGQKRKRDDTMEEKRSKRKVDDSSERAKKLRKDIDRKIKIVLRKACECGLIPSSASTKKSSSKSCTNVDAATLVHIFERAGLPASTMPEEETETKSSKSQKYTREKSQRDLKRAAQAYFESELSESDLTTLRDDDQAEEKRRAAKGQEKEVDKYKRKAEKLMARAAKAEKTKKTKTTTKQAKSVDEPVPETESLGFVVDTTGNPSLLKSADLPSAGKKGLHVYEPDGSIRYTVTPDAPVPLDPTIWEGVDIKTLPKAVREARRTWMAEKRGVRKTAKPGHKASRNADKGKDKDKAQRRDEERKEHERKLLRESRKAAKHGGSAGEDAPRFPLIEITTTSGPFTKEESAIARRTVRSTLKKEKRAAKEEAGRSKKSKKSKASK
ncbi:unnamed protein product [Zymoseptoria tritici ST99CH_1E4]|uniref:G-patch domain-containing protein n=1 Tax=Zymoseptoria tritici ST99CH_1E4 TaxID=1276532 RepID=A0A2H1FJQ5_ZYMTR|nr:unnamed protein product [Zymoseptoria tritici ST99CH_1E4]